MEKVKPDVNLSKPTIFTDILRGNNNLGRDVTSLSKDQFQIRAVAECGQCNFGLDETVRPTFTESEQAMATIDEFMAHARHLDGNDHADPAQGVWQITYNRICRGLLKFDIGEIPQATVQQRTVPEELQGRGAVYYRVWSAVDAQKAFARGHGVQASFHVTESWRNPPEGIITVDPVHTKRLGGHSMALSNPMALFPSPESWTGDDFFVCRNSWGKEWGNRGFGAMRHNVFDSEMYEAWGLITNCAVPEYFGDGVHHAIWFPGRDPDRIFFVYDIIDKTNDKPLAWTFASLRYGELNVEEFFVTPTARGRGFAKSMMQWLRQVCTQNAAPVRFWVPFADVDKAEKLTKVASFFRKFQLYFHPSPFPSSAFCVRHEGKEVPPPFYVPPRPTYFFAGSTEETIEWTKLAEKHDVSDATVAAAKAVFSRHAGALSRLAK